MSNKVEQINGVIKQTVGDKVSYLFPAATIIVTPSSGNIRTYYTVAEKEPDSVLFDNIDEKYGTATAVEFVDYLATNSFFFELPPSGVLDVNVQQDSVGLALEATQQLLLTALGLLGTEATLQSLLTGQGNLNLEATQQSVLSSLQGISGGQSDLSLEATQQLVLTALGSLATETTLQSLLTGQSSLNQETTQQSVLSALSGLNLEATQQAILTALGLLATEGTLQSLLTGQGNLSLESTQQSVLTALSGLNLESTQQSVLTALGSLATETTLQSLLTGQSSLNQETTQQAVLAALGGIGGLTPISFPEPFTDLNAALHTESVITQIDLKQTKDNLPLFYSRVSNGSGSQTHSTSNAETVMAVTTNGDYEIAQTFERFNYLTGKPKQIQLTATNFGAQANVIKRFGYFNGGVVAPYDTFDGIYIESDGTTYNVCIAKSGSVTSVPRASWDDPLDGTGASGLNIDFNNFLIIRIEFLWLGGGPVRFQIKTDNQVITFHTFKNASLITTIYIESPNQPIRYEIRSTGGAGSLDQICSTVGSSGGNDLIGVERGFDDFKNILLSSTANDYLVYTAELKPTHLDVTVSILDYDVLFTTNDDFQYQVILNPTFSASPTYQNIANSALRIAPGDGTITVSGGTVLRSGYGTSKSVIQARQTNVIRLGSAIDGTPNNIAYLVRPLTSNARANSAINWLENN